LAAIFAGDDQESGVKVGTVPNGGCLSSISFPPLISRAHNGPGGRQLTLEQLAGKAPLPNGKMSRRAGRIAVFGKSERMIGPIFRLEKSRSRSNDGDEEGVDVTLPPSVDTLTVWLRFECSDPAGAVGFMGVGIEDITSGQSKTGNPGREPVLRSE